LAYHFLFILPTTRCLSHCEFCFYETGHSCRVEAVDYREPLADALESLVQHGLKQVIFSGGEPLLAPHLPELLAQCGGRDLHLLVLTNGRLLDEPTLALLEQHGVDEITISAHEPCEQLRGAVHRTLFSSRYVPSLLSCVTRANIGAIPELLELSSRFNLPHLFTPAFIPEDAPAFERLSLRGLSKGEWAQLLAVLEPWAGSTGSQFYLEMIRDHYSGLLVHPGFCPMGSAGLVIDADGSVYPCFHRHDLRPGNLLEDPWDEIFDRLTELGDPLLGAPCFGEHCLSMFAGIRE
jgi:MoaA/NifB/PqqE/SkfB family radical SAM enzyme